MSDQTPETPDTTILDPEHLEPHADPTMTAVPSAEQSSVQSADTAPTQESMAISGAAPEPDPTAPTSGSLPVSSVPAPAPAEPGPAIESAVSGEVHKFRLVHEIYDATEIVLHSVRTSAPIALKDATEILALLAKFGL